jgi:hypothetical protein
MKRAVVVLLLLIANAIFVTRQNTPSAPAPVELSEQGRQPRNAEAAAAQNGREESLRDNDPVADSAADVVEGFATIDRALIQDPAEYIGGDRL